MRLLLTERQLEVLSYVNGFIAANGFPPTRSEIANHFGFRSPNAADCHLHQIAMKGYIRITPGISRGIQILKAAA